MTRHIRFRSIGILTGITCLMILLSSGASQASPIAPCPFSSRTFYLKGVPPDLDLDAAPPTATTPQSADSPSLTKSGGNLYKLIGTWDSYSTITGGCELTSLSDLHVWLGLRNSDDQGTKFDLKAEVFNGLTQIGGGETLCIDGVTRNPDKAIEATVHFGPVSPTVFDGTSELFLKLSTRIGTGTTCTGHSNATGLRTYYNAVSRPSEFDAGFTSCGAIITVPGEESLTTSVPCPCGFTFTLEQNVCTGTTSLK